MRALGAATALLAALLTACGGGGDAPAAASIAAGTSLTASIASAQTGLAYDIDIWLPPDYGQGTAAFRVVYATDCEYRFATLVSVLQRRAAAGTSMILVNVCAMGSARRWIDFTLPGAAAYFRFLTLELVPFVEARYRALATGRILTGHSLSGELALYALYLEDPAHRYFASIVSEECSCWYDASMRFDARLAAPAALAQAMATATAGTLPIDLVLAGDTTSNQPNVAAVYALLLGQRYRGLRLVNPTYSIGHVPMDGPAFDEALTFILAGS